MTDHIKCPNPNCDQDASCTYADDSNGNFLKVRHYECSCGAITTVVWK